MKELSLDRLKELLDYEPDTGYFKFKVARSQFKPGQKAGGVNNRGYEQVRIDGCLYLTHRLAWLFVYGEWPSGELDHINRISTDNRISNLRIVTRSQNNQNTSLYRNNKSGLRGVGWDQTKQRWQAQIRVNTKIHHIGYFTNKEDAYAAYLAAASKYHTHNPVIDASRAA